MGQLLQYSGITTKVRSLEGKLLKAEDYRRLSEIPDIRLALDCLKQFPGYQTVFADVDEAHLHRGEIEKLIIRSLFLDFEKIYRFCGMKQRKFLMLYYKRYEIDLLKYLFRLAFNHENQPFYISTRRSFFQHFSKLDLDKLTSADSPEALIAALNGSEYERILSRVASHPESVLYDYEITLDLYHFSMFWKEKNKILKGRELNVITKEFGSKIDMLNIQWIYRAKKYYNMPSHEIFAMAIPIHYKLRKEQFIALAESDDMHTFYDILSKTWYGTRYDSICKGNFEQIYQQIQSRLYLREAKRDPYSITFISSYLYRREEELNKITTILECIRYGLNPEETLLYAGGNHT